MPNHSPDGVVMNITEEVRAALADHHPIVALETSVLSQGLPPPHNRESAYAMDRAIRAEGAVPAWTALDAGRLCVGLDESALDRFCDRTQAIAKVARRDMPAVLASGGMGATTVSATLWIAARAGIDLMATGGIGGVHPHTGDVSADLLEMARVRGMVVCAGPKSIVDPVATLERLEELGVLVVGYATSRLPFFLVREADLPLEHRVDTPGDASALLRRQRALSVESSILLCQPVAEQHALEASVVADAVVECERRAARAGVSGKAVTPFLLAALAEVTRGASLAANLALLHANAVLAARVAVEAVNGGRD